MTHDGRGAPPLPAVIREGERNKWMTSFAGSMRRFGSSARVILVGLRKMNDERCQPPLDDAELRQIARSVAHYPASATPEEMARHKALYDLDGQVSLAEPVNDLTLAATFARIEHGELRYCPQWRKWLAWDGTRWAVDDAHEVERRVKRMMRAYLALVANIEDSKERDEAYGRVTRYTQRKKLDDVLAVARSEALFIVTPDLLDADPWLLNVENGTINLRTGKKRRHDPRDLITKLSPVELDPKATAPRWARFLREVTKGDPELQAFLQRAVGYTLTGDTSEECLFFPFGPGKNGKTTFIETVRRLLGEDDGYAQQIPFTVLLSDERGNNAHDAHRARMYRARLVTAMEATKGRAFNAAIINQLTSNDRQVARRLYEMPFEFTPTHKLWVAANHKPPVREQTEGFWRRMRLVPFTFTVPRARRDKRLDRKLRAELPGILNWAIAGCLAWQRHGLPEPQRVARATTAYRQENDPLREFIEQECRLGDGHWTATQALYERFKLWWPSAHGDRTSPPSAYTLTGWLRERRDVRAKKRRGERGWDNVALRRQK
jgi:putative DNA primase/helicase